MAHSKEKDDRLFVNLGRPCKITQIAIYPRTDCCQDRYADMKVYLKKDLSVECTPIHDWSNDIEYIKQMAYIGLIYNCDHDVISDSIAVHSLDHALQIVEIEAQCEDPIVGDCDVADNDKIDCGWDGILESTCLNRGCCWSTEVSGIPWCYKKA